MAYTTKLGSDKKLARPVILACSFILCFQRFSFVNNLINIVLFPMLESTTTNGGRFFLVLTTVTAVFSFLAGQ